MDHDISAAARALSAADPLAALNRVALRDDAPALALRGIAMAQLGDLERARTLVRAAARAFGSAQPVARARCAVAEAEIALASRDLGWPAQALKAARATLAAHGDRLNAAYARHLEIRHLLLTGDLQTAQDALAGFDPLPLPPAIQAAHHLASAGLALRQLRARDARAALDRAADAARDSGIAALQAEVDHARALLAAPAATLLSRGDARPLPLDEVETLLQSPALVVDACRHLVCAPGQAVSLARRPVLFALARTLAEAWPRPAPRQALIAQAFRTRYADDTHRARLRVEIGRLRTAMHDLAGIQAVPGGFTLVPRAACDVAVLARPTDQPHAAVLACLADGLPWSSSALALALGASQRTVQRTLEALAAQGRAQAFGRGRARRWSLPAAMEIATPLLLPLPLSAH
ncbi:helix-turn-helix domain-containing protein [Bordetella genomosp. 13]|uniref:helix-turn-helix domain-containing protein n=1 Tax=Bordetella genomosp. 13 TaxID=463040 RepID=UPI0011A73DB1|nr:helix-turn-helix domain-containing protein [Bordetella genomosp. 13]